MRNKLQTVAEYVGDSGDLPAGTSLRSRVTTLEGGGGSTDEKIKITASDTTAGYQDDKLAVTNGIEKATLNPGANEQLQLQPTYGSSANTVCEGDDSRLSDSRAPTAHDLSGALHNSSTLADLNSKVSDATLIDTADSRLSDSRTPTAHDLAGALHNSATLSELNAKVSDATLIDTTDSRLSDDRNDADAIHDNVAAEINAITTKATPVSADVIILEDSAASWAKKKATLSSLPGGGGTDADAIHDNVAAEINAITTKATPVDADVIVLEDSADSWNKKKATLSSLPGAVTASGSEIEMLTAAPASNRSTTSTSYVGIGGTPGDIIDEFTAPDAGDYAITAMLNLQGSTNWAYIRVVFDYDTTPIYVGTDDPTWFAAYYSGDTRRYVFHGKVNLVAGTHKVKIEWKVVSGTIYFYTSQGNASIRGQLISGSGAQGIILDEAAKTADQSITAGSVVTLTSLDLVFTANTGEKVEIGWSLETGTGSASTYFRAVYYKIDSGSWNFLSGESGPWDMTFESTKILTMTSGGEHTVEFGFRADTITVTVRGGDTEPVTGWGYPVSNTWAKQHRGGLVPVYDTEGNLVQDTPSSWKIRGGGVIDSSGQVVIDLPVGHEEDIPPASPTIYDDEFNSTLNARWAWTGYGGAGAPSGGSESWGVANGRLVLVTDADGGGTFDPASGGGHFLSQDVPPASSDFLCATKMSAIMFTEPNSVALVVTDGTSAWTNCVTIMFQNKNSSGTLDCSYKTGGTWTYEPNTFAEPFTIDHLVVAIEWIQSTSTLNMKVGYDLDYMTTILSLSGISWTPDRMGLLMYNNSSVALSCVARFDWFRVVL
jgi:hypothetical protein